GSSAGCWALSCAAPEPKPRDVLRRGAAPRYTSLVDPSPELLFDGPADAARRIVLAHGAGAGMKTSFLCAMAAGLAGRGIGVARFEFPYMADRALGRKAPPDREPVLRD